ncbi:MAG: hypothetical protein IJD50_07085 [Clostridia bacterium]|nr:hypothetical protein [Clostridia bacterium]
MLYHVNELAENVDETPEFEIREDNTTLLSNRPKMSAMPQNVTGKDITNPSDNENYAEYLMSDRYFWGSEHTNIKNANIYIEYVKSIKDELIKSVTMLNTWVKDDNINSRYRISYDQSNDVVYLEKISDNSLYTRITSTYVNGKMVIDAYQYQIYDQNSGVEISCHYEEDKVLYYYELSDFAYRNLFMLTADLSVENPVNVCLSYGTMDQGDRIGYQMYKYLYRMGTDEESALDVYNTYFIDNLSYEFNNFSDTIIINNSNDDYVFSAQYNEESHSYFFTVDMYELEGYTQIIRGDSHYKVVVGENTFITANADALSADDCIIYQTEDMYVMAYLQEYGTVRLVINVEARNQNLTQSRALTEFLDYMGLSFKDESIYDKFDLLDNASEVLKQYTYFDYSYSCYVSPDEMERIFAINQWTSVTYAEIMDMLGAKAVDIHEQVEDEEYYALYASAVSGKVSYNDDDTLNLAAVSITLTDNGILTSGEEYSLVAYLTNGYVSYPLDKSSILFAGESISINLNANVNIPTDFSVGKYHIIAYLATTIDSAEVRVSGIYTLEGEGEFDKISTVSANENSYFIRVISTPDLVVAKDDIFALKGQATYDEELNYLNLGAISGSLSNGYVLTDTDYVTLKATFYDEDDNAVYALEDSFLFGTRALSASVTLDEMPALEEGTYKLKINFNVKTKENDVIFNANYVQEDSFGDTILVENRADVDIIVLEAFDSYIEFRYVKVAEIDLQISYENDIIDMSNSTLTILYPGFFEGLDDVTIDICFNNVDEEKSDMYFAVDKIFELMQEEGLVFPTINLTDYSIEGGEYTVEYRFIVSNQYGEMKLDKFYTTDMLFDIASTTTDNVVEG